MDDIEADLVSGLTTLLGVAVSTHPPAMGSLDATGLQVRASGGYRQDIATGIHLVTLHAWGPDEVAAANLARRALACIESGEIEGHRWAAATSLPYHNPHPDYASQERYTVQVQISGRRRPIR